MTTEEKAKRYDEALEWMRELYPGLHGETKEDAEHYFPELKESEESEDERIRKAIVELVKRTPSSMFDADTEFNWIGASHDEILAWLEKQKAAKTPQWMIDFLNDIRTASINKEGYDDYDGRREYEGKILAIIRWLEGNFIQQKEQKPVIVKPHNGDDTNPYDMSVSEAQDYAIKRGFSVPFNDGEVYVDERHITQTIGNILRWADEHPKEQKPITINQDEKEFLADEIAAFLCNYDKEFDGEDPVPSEIAEHFYLLGKQAQKQKPADEQFPPLEGLDAIKAKYYDNGFKNGFDEGVESVKPAEWSKNDTVFLNEITDFFENHTIRLQHDLDMYAHWLKSLPGRFNLQPKPEQKPEVKMKWFVARDSCSRDDCGLAAYKHKPFRASIFWVDEYSLGTIKLPWQAFPDLKWEDEPMEVEIIIRKK